jgi:hypothetical protein
MTPPGLRITGPNPEAYVVGEPLDVLAGDVHLGRLNVIRISPDGGAMELDDFQTTDLARLKTWRTARLIVVEILNFLVDRCPSASVFRISLSADVEAFNGTETGARRLAQARMQMLQGVGASDIRMTPKPHPRHAAHFAVSGIWHYTTSNAQCLADALADERLAFARLQAEAAQAVPTPPAETMIGRLLTKERHK